jgi:hypothetical protein
MEYCRKTIDVWEVKVYSHLTGQFEVFHTEYTQSAAYEKYRKEAEKYGFSSVKVEKKRRKEA